MYLPNLKSLALPIPALIGGSQKLGRPWIRPRSLFSKVFNGLLFGWILQMYHLPNMKSVALPVYEIIAIEVWGGDKPLS